MQFRAHSTRVRAAGLLLAVGVTAGLVSASAGGVSAAPATTAATNAARTARLRHQPGEQGLRRDVRPGLAGAVPLEDAAHKGQLLTQYYGIAHHSLPNYIAQISGQGPNPQTQADCQLYSDFLRRARRRRRAGGRAAAASTRRRVQDRRRPARRRKG